MQSDRQTLLEQYRSVRRASIAMCEPLTAEEHRIQPMGDVSPPWWNLGHTSWFFVRNVLEPFGGQRLPEDAEFDYVLNSYYVSLGNRLSRPRRGCMTRPTNEEIYRYRASVDERVEQVLKTVAENRLEDLAFVMTIGMHHERQHQELFYTEIKNILYQNPPQLRRPYRNTTAAPGTVEPLGKPEFVHFEGGLHEFGNLEGGWCWDNELPVHMQYLYDFAIQTRLVTNGEYLEFIQDGGYRRQLLWLDNGWARAQEEGWDSPLYWEQRDGQWRIWTLGGMRELDPSEPVCHVSFYEADAFARWKSETFDIFRGVRLPTEREWEYAARTAGVDTAAANLLDSGRLHPAPPASSRPSMQMLGDVWEWTSSYYEPYPGYKSFPGALAEYNGKFMDNQRVLRGGSCVTERDHIRISYRNFWAGPTRFQFTGFRLARDS
jgi:ergothioneine biosynthesis protein EgtB